MSSLKKFLEAKKYSSIKMSVTSTGHHQCNVKINDIEGSFIVDTGASSSCVDFQSADFFKLLSEDSDIRAAGAGATNMLTKTSVDNKVEIGSWSHPKMKLVLFDLSHVNAALEEHDSEGVNGIIGADLLKKSKAIIDYKTNRLYLKN